jgi:hypothetical protein
MGTIAIIISALIGVFIVGYGFRRWSNGTWSAKIMGRLTFLYGLYFSFFTGSYSSLVLPGIGSIGLGAVTGGAIGWAASAIIGTIGVVTGGVGIAIGALGMATIGAVLGAIGAGSGGFGIRATTYFLVTPWFWVPLIIIGLFLMFRNRKSNIKNLEAK